MSDDREKALASAQKLVEKKRYDRALIEYQRVLKTAPNDDRVLLKVADLQGRMGAHEAAIETLQQIGKHYAAEGFTIKAVAVYKQIWMLVQRHFPQEVIGRYSSVALTLANLYREQGLVGDALNAYQEHAERLDAAGRSRESLEVLGKIAEIATNNPVARKRYAEMLERHGEFDRAYQELNASVDLFLAANKRDEAMAVLDRMLTLRNEPVIARRLAEMHLDRGGPDDAAIALQKLQACFQSTQRDLETLRVLTRALEAARQVTKSLEVRKLMVRIARDKGDMDVARELVTALRRDAPYDKSIEALAQTVGLGQAQPESPSESVLEVEDADAELEDLSMAELAEEAVDELVEDEELLKPNSDDLAHLAYDDFAPQSVPPAAGYPGYAYGGYPNATPAAPAPYGSPLPASGPAPNYAAAAAGQNGFDPNYAGAAAGQNGYDPNYAAAAAGQTGYDPSYAAAGQAGYDPNYAAAGQAGYDPNYAAAGQAGYDPSYAAAGQAGYDPSYAAAGQAGYDPSYAAAAAGQTGYDPDYAAAAAGSNGALNETDDPFGDEAYQQADPWTAPWGSQSSPDTPAPDNDSVFEEDDQEDSFPTQPHARLSFESMEQLGRVNGADADADAAVAGGNGSGQPLEPVAEEDLQDVLEEVEFFVSQRLYDDAISLLEENIRQLGEHAKLVDELRRVRHEREQSLDGHW